MNTKQLEIERRREYSRLWIREKMKDPVFREKFLEKRREYNKSEKGKRARRLQQIKLARKRGVVPSTPELNRSLALKYMHTNEVRKKNKENALAKKEKHPLALCWSLISPSGKIFKVKNLKSFIRDNMSLFDEAIWGKRTAKSIHDSLGEICPRRKNCKGSCYGWRWHIDSAHQETFLAVLPLPQK